MGTLVMLGQFFLSLSILIVLHEMGHFFPARWFNTRVEKFYLFFDPWFSLFKKKVGDTEYGIGWLPLGGYVKIAGMIDESMDREQMQQPPKPWEFRSKPAWQRLIIMLGGVTVNFLLGFFLYGMVLWIWGQEYLPAENVKYGIVADSLGQELGLRTGDHILKIDDRDFTKFSDPIVRSEIVFNEAKTITVRRRGEEKVLDIPENFTQVLTTYENKDQPLFYPRFPFVIGSVPDGKPAANAGIQVDDQIIALNGRKMPYFDQFSKAIKRHKNKEVNITLLRNQKDTVTVSLTTTKEGLIGVGLKPLNHFFKTTQEKYSFAQAMPMGFEKGWNFLVNQFKAFGQMFRGKIKAKDSLGGFGSIASQYGTVWDWQRFWTMTAAISLILAFMNLLPIPALDGGHVMFLLYEMVTGRKPSDKFMEYATIIGFILVFSLIIFANGQDFLRWWNK